MKHIRRQKQIENDLKLIAAGVNDEIKERFGKMGFALIVFDFGRPGISNYISNAQRSDMIAALRETADRLEQRQDIPPAHQTVQ